MSQSDTEFDKLAASLGDKDHELVGEIERLLVMAYEEGRTEAIADAKEKVQKLVDEFTEAMDREVAQIHPHQAE